MAKKIVKIPNRKRKSTISKKNPMVKKPKKEFTYKKSEAFKNYPPPESKADDEVFVKTWADFIESVTTRDNFVPAYLHQLEVLCDLFVEYHALNNFLRDNGYSYEQSGGRYGDQVKAYPHVGQLNQVKYHISTYMRSLGLQLVKDKAVGPEGSGEEGWE